MITRRVTAAFNVCYRYRRFATKANEEYGTGAVGPGRKQFQKGWSFMKARFPRNVQERWHRAPIQRLVNYETLENFVTEEVGAADTLDWRMYFRTTALDGSDIEDTDPEDLERLSCWHDVPLVFKDTRTNELLCNYVNEIPRGGLAKMECATNEAWNPIKQDVKKGNLRYFTYGKIPFNYGFLPQTWEDPTKKSAFSDSDTLGDNDPIDVVELSSSPLSCGEVTPVKLLGLLGLIDEGETDWKVIAISTAHEKANIINSVDDVNQVLGTGTLESIRDWFKMYKTTDGKPENSFTHEGAFLGPDRTRDVIDEGHKHWKDLMLNKTESELDKTSVTYIFLTAQGVVSDVEAPSLPPIQISRDAQHERFPTAKDRNEMTGASS